MQLLRVQDEDLNWLAGKPESAMGLQIVLLPREQVYEPILVVGGLIVLDFLHGGGVSLDPWMKANDNQNRESAFEEWLHKLPPFDRSLQSGLIGAGRSPLFPNSIFPSPPILPSPPYGHLPYRGACGKDEVFYRWEPFPRSRRIDQITGDVKSGTFAAPPSEVPFVTTGFGAVGRFALPSLPPAKWRWELRPPARTPFRCGASVPLYGQSGGGVEVEFPDPFVNVGPIANPFILPAL